MKKIKISLILNLLIVLFVSIGTVLMFLGIKFMPDKTLLQASKIGMFKFYTVDSNILIGIISLILSIKEIKLLKNKIEEIPKSVYVLKLVGTSSIAITFLVTLLFLAPQYGFYAMYNNSNLFFHLVVPVLALISFILFEKFESKYKYTLYGLIPMVLYSLYYSATIFYHFNGKESLLKYDFYGFLHGNINNVYISLPLMFIIGYVVNILILFLNKKFAK